MPDPAARQLVDRILETSALPLGPELDCPYLPGRKARHRGFVTDHCDPEVYHALLDRRFRRSGNLFYQPQCPNCRECVQMRIPVGGFRPSKSQRRVWRDNHDLSVTVRSPVLTDEKWRLYARYLEQQHDGTMSAAYDDLERFLYRSPVDSIEFTYHLDGRLIGVAVADRSTSALSSVYMFFDPNLSGRSPGTYSMLWEIDYCRRSDIPYYYVGFYVADCRKMNYKSRFKPHERLTDDLRWVAHDR